MYSLHRSHLPSPSVRSQPAETSGRARPRSQPRRHRLSGYGSHAGTPRFLGSPSHASATLYDSGRFGRPHPTGRHDAAPAIPTTRTPAIPISELNTVASASAVYASSGALPHPHARLASGWWLAFAGRESNPLDFSERFLSATSDILLSQAYPGATKSGVSQVGVSPGYPKKGWWSGGNVVGCEDSEPQTEGEGIQGL